MTTSKKLWLGFGTLTTLLVVVCVAILVRVRQIEQLLHEQAHVARNRSHVAGELKNNIVGFPLAVRAFVQLGDVRFLQEMAEKIADVERYLNEYQRLAVTERQRELAARFAVQWQEFHAFGQTLLNSKDRPLPREDLLRLANLRLGLEKFLDEEMHMEAIESYEASRDETFRVVRAIVGFTLLLLAAGVALAVLTSGVVGRAIVRSEQVLAEEKERLRTTLSSIGDAVIATDVEGRITTMNGVAESLTGWAAAEAVGRPLEAIFHIVSEETHEPVKNPATRALQEGVVVGLANHTLLIARDGTERPIDDSAAPIRYKDGQIVGCVLVFRDVSERRHDEQRLAEQARLLNVSNDAILMRRMDGTITYWNHGAQALYGWTSAEALGKETHDLLQTRFPRGRGDVEAELLQRGHWSGELVHTRRNGTLVTVLCRKVLDRDAAGRPALVLESNNDISDRKRAEEWLRLLSEAAAVVLYASDSDTLLQALFARVSGPLGADLYLNYRITDTGDGLQLVSSFGLPEEFLRSKVAWEESLCGTAAQSRQAVVVSRVQQSNDPKIRGLQTLGVRAYAGFPLLSGNLLLGTLCFASRGKDEFQPDELEFLETICRYVAVAYERLRLFHKLREADLRKDEFLATLAHELRNPLAPIRNGLQIMQLARDPEALEETRSMMGRQLEQMTRLIDDLMDLSRISRGKLILQKTRMPLAEAIRNAVDTSRPLMEARQQEFILDLPPEPISVDGDLTRLSQVFANLLNNAAKYTERGGRVQLTVERRGSDVVVKVRDNGVGIPAPMLTRVFDMFAQVDRSLEKAQGGLGIGLNIVQRLVEMHGGKITAESGGQGMGSTFTVCLPVAEAFAPSGSGVTAREGMKPSLRRRVLVVDDNVDSALSLAKLLQVLGNETQTAHDGLEALAAAEAFQPDVILMDLGMPKLNGFDACSRIRQQPEGRNIVIIAQTGWGQEEDRRKSSEAGFDYHLVKPVDPAALTKLLAELQPRKS